MPSSRPSPGDPGSPDRGTDLEIRVKQVLRPTIQVLPSGAVRVTAPPGTHIPSLIETNRAWIERKRREIQEMARAAAGQDGRILLGGRFYRLEAGPSCGIDGEGGVVTYTTPADLKRHLKGLLRKDLIARLAVHAARMHLAFAGITVREQRSRWASCSRRGRISVNLRVLALPEDIRDYLVVHELAHLREPNHSRRYWGTVGAFYPGYRRAEEDLKKYWILVERDGIWKVLKNV